MFLQRKYLEATYMIPRISRIYKEFSKLSNKTGKNPIRRWPKSMKMLLKMAKKHMKRCSILIVIVVQSPSRVWLFATPWTTMCQASLSLIISRSFPKFMSIASVMPSSHLILWRPLLLLPSIFSQHQGLFQRVSCSHQVTKILELQLQHQSFQWVFRVDFP